MEKCKKLLSSKKAVIGVSLLGLYLIVSGLSLVVFTAIKGGGGGVNVSQGDKNPKATAKPELPRTESCPINGAMFPKPAREVWETRRPMTVMIENHADSRPPSGVSRADVVYEAVAEGGITRFLNVFYCGVADNDTNIGPVRSARIYFLDYASEYGNYPLFVHQGGANNICSNCPGRVKPYGDINPKVDVYKLLDKIGWSNGRYGNDMDGQTNLGMPAIWRDLERIPGAAWEHTVIGSTDKIYDEAAKREFTNKDPKGIAWDTTFVKWSFVDGKKSETPNASDISFQFWAGKPDYDVEWKYDPARNLYLRFNGGKEHTDFNTKAQLTASNVVVIYAKEEGPVDKELHMFYTTTGKGKALVFQNGTVITATWQKDSRTARTRLFDEKGKEIPFVKGVIWFEILPIGNVVNYN